MEQGINSYMDWWNVYAFKRQTLDNNMIHIAQGFKSNDYQYFETVER